MEFLTTGLQLNWRPSLLGAAALITGIVRPSMEGIYDSPTMGLHLKSGHHPRRDAAKCLTAVLDQLLAIEFAPLVMPNAYKLTASRKRLGVWHHIVGTYNGMVQKLYVDGNLDNQDALSGAIPDNGADVHIGYEAAGFSGSPFSGIIDDLRLYNRALSASEVKQLYNAGR